ncbi:MAG: guanylate kinase [Gammaproteobacteria bacterium]|nr:guanylate kinase [Gammaproteobacteria bacterium]
MNLNNPECGHLFVITAPSGAGKTTLVHGLMEANKNLRFSISYTTREPRAIEVHEKDYFFVSNDAFQVMVDAGDFLEHARVFDYHYGTSKTQVEGLLNEGYSVILEIDWQGAQQVRNHMPDCRSIFILPPSVGELRRRLTGRGTDSEDVIQRRFQDALEDMSHWNEFDFVVINDDLKQALVELQAIVGDEGEANSSSNDKIVRQVKALLNQA